MAILDPRILPIIGVLAASGMDWLAFELVDGIARGRQPEESEDALVRARQRAISSGRFDEMLGEAKYTAEPEPILGDVQLRWVAAYIEGRLGDAIDALEASFACLESIELTIDDGVRTRPIQPFKLVLVDDDEVYEVAQVDTPIAREGLDALRAALKRWLADNVGPELQA